MIYLDHNATTSVDPQVVEAMLPYLGERFGNPSSVHRPGRLARAALDGAREEVAALVGVQSGQVIFTSGGTEANNLALFGLTAHLPRSFDHQFEAVDVGFPDVAAAGVEGEPGIGAHQGAVGDEGSTDPEVVGITNPLHGLELTHR